MGMHMYVCTYLFLNARARQCTFVKNIPSGRGPMAKKAMRVMLEGEKCRATEQGHSYMRYCVQSLTNECCCANV